MDATRKSAASRVFRDAVIAAWPRKRYGPRSKGSKDMRNELKKPAQLCSHKAIILPPRMVIVEHISDLVSEWHFQSFEVESVNFFEPIAYRTVTSNLGLEGIASFASQLAQLPESGKEQCE